jgi:6-pyruvoyltetrahydropterin/6-carboxytetrahydropterin synthase
MVSDFKDVKERAIALCEKLDHKILLPSLSPSFEITVKELQIEIKSVDKFYSFPKEDCEMIPIQATTAEELARHIYGELKKDLPGLVKVYVSESTGSTAYFTES